MEGLLPGEVYKIDLSTTTGRQVCETPLTKTVLTAPSPVKWLQKEEVTATTAVITWTQPEGNSRLRGYTFLLKPASGLGLETGCRGVEMCVRNNERNDNRLTHVELSDLTPDTEYALEVNTVCVYTSEKQDKKRQSLVTTSDSARLMIRTGHGSEGETSPGQPRAMVLWEDGPCCPVSPGSPPLRSL